MARSYGDFGDPFGVEKATPEARDSGRDLEKLVRVLEKLEASTGAMTKAELFLLQQQVGLRVAEFNRSLLRIIDKAR